MTTPAPDEFERIVGDWRPEEDPDQEYLEIVAALTARLEELGGSPDDDPILESLIEMLRAKIPLHVGDLALVKGTAREVNESGDLQENVTAEFSGLGKVVSIRGFYVIDDPVRDGQPLPGYMADHAGSEKTYFLAFGESVVEKVTIYGKPNIDFLKAHLPADYCEQLLEIAALAHVDRSTALNALAEIEYPELDEVLRVEEAKLLHSAFGIDGWTQCVLSSEGAIAEHSVNEDTLWGDTNRVYHNLVCRLDAIKFVDDNGRRVPYLDGRYQRADGEFYDFLIHCKNATNYTYIDELAKQKPSS